MMGPNFNPSAFAMQMLQSNPQMANNPMAQTLIQAIQTNNPAAGQQLAENICKTYGLTKEQALRQAIQGLGLR